MKLFGQWGAFNLHKYFPAQADELPLTISDRQFSGKILALSELERAYNRPP